jgi:cytochrome P450 family 142 subfamily A polypeptide 1
MLPSSPPYDANGPLDLMDLDLHTDDPYPVYAWLREHHPVYRDANGVWWVSRYDDVSRVALDPDTFTSRKGNRPLLPNDESFIHLDGKEHMARRGLIQNLFTPAAALMMQDHIREQTDELIDAVIEQGHCDFVEDIAARLPVRITAEMTGVPEMYWDDVRRWLDAFGEAGNGPGFVTEEVNEAFLNWGSLHMQLIDERRSNPEPDILTLWAQAHCQGVELTDDQLLWEHTMLTFGGLETTRNAMSSGLKVLLEHPEQLAWLKEHPEGMENAAEEILRWTMPFIAMSRHATRDTELRGMKIAADECVAMLWPAANRDPSKFEDPDAFNIRRSFKNRSLSFGVGRHVCLGAHLARMETKVCMEQVLARMPDIALDGEATKVRSCFISGYRAMPVRFTPGPRVRS